MRCMKVLWTSFEKKLNLKTIQRLGKQTEFCIFSQEKVKFYSDDSKMLGKVEPPQNVYGMKVLDRSAFKIIVMIPSLIVGNQYMNHCLKLLKNYIFKNNLLKSIKQVNDSEKILFLDPEQVRCWNDFGKDLKDKLIQLNIQEDKMSETALELGYENWSTSQLLKAILPKDEPNFSGYSIIGHIIQLNLKDYLLDYKQVIGEILLDKVSPAKTVVYKKGIISNTYRTFVMEVICGVHDFIVSVKENNCTFEFDFSKVYWNPRLSTEHERIVAKINLGDALFDVFAGVGPFAIPAAKKKCMVYANDLNPDSYKWLNHNISLNKKCQNYIKTYNKDGSDFILNDFKEQILKIWQDEFFIGNIYVIMNLPMLAPTFIKYFKELIKKDDLKNKDLKEICLPIIHCYFFSKGENEREVFERESGMNLDNIEYKFHLVRSVSSHTQMHRISFTLPKDYFFEKCVRIEANEPLLKKMRIN